MRQSAVSLSPPFRDVKREGGGGWLCSRGGSVPLRACPAVAAGRVACVRDRATPGDARSPHWQESNVRAPRTLRRSACGQRRGCVAGHSEPRLTAWRKTRRLGHAGYSGAAPHGAVEGTRSTHGAAPVGAAERERCQSARRCSEPSRSRRGGRRVAFGTHGRSRASRGGRRTVAMASPERSVGTEPPLAARQKRARRALPIRARRRSDGSRSEPRRARRGRRRVAARPPGVRHAEKRAGRAR